SDSNEASSLPSLGTRPLRAQRIPSNNEVFPLPFEPTTTMASASKSNSCCRGKPRKPLSSTDNSLIPSSFVDAVAPAVGPAHGTHRQGSAWSPGRYRGLPKASAGGRVSTAARRLFLLHSMARAPGAPAPRLMNYGHHGRWPLLVTSQVVRF